MDISSLSGWGIAVQATIAVFMIVFVVLGVMALVGRELLQLLGIDLGAFGVVGGIRTYYGF